MSETTVYKFSDIEGQVEITLPSEEYFDPAGSGFTTPNQYPFAFKGNKGVMTFQPQGKGKPALRVTKNYNDAAGFINQASYVLENQIRFNGKTDRGQHVTGIIQFATDGSGGGQGTFNLYTFKDGAFQVECVVTGPLEVDVSGAEVSDQTNEAPTDVRFPDVRPSGN